MESKEALDNLLKALNATLIATHSNELKEEVKELIKTFTNIEKDLDILDEIRQSFSLIDYGKEYDNRYALKDNLTNIIYTIDEEHYNRFKRWLENDK